MKYKKVFAVSIYILIVYNTFNIVYKYAILKENINLFILYIAVTISFMSIPAAIALITGFIKNTPEKNQEMIQLESSNDGTYKNDLYILKCISGCWYLSDDNNLIDHGMDKEKLISRSNLELR